MRVAEHRARARATSARLSELTLITCRVRLQDAAVGIAWLLPDTGLDTTGEE